MPANTSTLGDDLLIGVPAIAAWLREPESRIYHWATTKKFQPFDLAPN